MKPNMKYSLTIALALFSGSYFSGIQAMESSSSLMQQQQELQLVQKFIQKYAPPEEVCALIKQHKKSIFFVYTEQIKEIPGYYIKGNDIARLINNVRMGRYLERNNFTKLGVTKKHVCCVGEKLIIFAEKVKSGKWSPVTLEEIQQCHACMVATGYKDWAFNPTNFPNLVRDVNGKLIFIDTEDISFSIEAGLATKDNKKYMTQEAWDWLQKQKQLEKHGYLPNDNRFDEDIDFTTIKILLKEHVGFKL